MADAVADVVDDNNAHARQHPVNECVCPLTPPLKSVLPPGADLSLRVGNPHYGRRMQLYCRTGFNLIIQEDSSVAGVDEDMNECAIMEFTSVDFGGLVRIRGVKSSNYLAMNSKGRLYGEPNPEKEETVFIEGVLGQYNTYMSYQYQKFKWYVAIKKNGKQKPGNRTKWGQKAIQFLPRRIVE